MIGDRLRAAREAADMSQRELEDACGDLPSRIHQVAICQYETGGRVPRLETIQRLCRALGVDLTTIIGDDHA